MRRFYAPNENFDGQTIVLGVDETRHLRDVLRLRPGAEVSVFDGNGQEFLCTVESIEKRISQLSVIGQVDPASPESTLKLTIAAAALKGEKFDLVVQKSVELGVARLIPLMTDRGDVKLKDSSRVDRWQRIALEATKQCGRAVLMDIARPISFDEALKLTDPKILFSERKGQEFASFDGGKVITALVGPEGGWSDAELFTADAAGIAIVTLGGRILRAETASIAIAAILQHRFGDLN